MKFEQKSVIIFTRKRQKFWSLIFSDIKFLMSQCDGTRFLDIINQIILIGSFRLDRMQSEYIIIIVLFFFIFTLPFSHSRPIRLHKSFQYLLGRPLSMDDLGLVYCFNLVCSVQFCRYFTILLIIGQFTELI